MEKTKINAGIMIVILIYFYSLCIKVAYVSDNNVVRASGDMLCYLSNILF